MVVAMAKCSRGNKGDEFPDPIHRDGRTKDVCRVTDGKDFTDRCAQLAERLGVR